MQIVNDELEISSPYHSVPAEKITVQIIWAAKPEKIEESGTTVPQIMNSIKQALSFLEEEEIASLEKIIIAPNKKGYIFNFVLKKEKN